MNKRIILGALLVTALFLMPGTSRARLYNVNTGRFQTMDTYAGNNEDPLSLHKYLYAQDNPVMGRDPSGHAVYFVERHFQGFPKAEAFLANYGHGYLLFTDTSDDGFSDPFMTHKTIIDTFSWHPYSWDFDTHAQPGVPGRVWEMHPEDTRAGILHSASLVTKDPGQQSILFNYIEGWIHQSGCGRDYANPIDDPSDPGKNEIGNPHIPAPSGGVYYSLRGQNCVWWSTIMLAQSGINVRPNVYEAIRDFNHGIGYASEVILGQRNAYDVGTLNGRPFYVWLSLLPGYNISGFDTGL